MLYTLLGLPAVVTGPNLAFRLGIFAALLLQYREVQRSVALVADGVISHTIAILVCWTIYPLTNVYMRSAATEYFAVCLLTCATCALFRAFVSEEDRAQRAAMARVAIYFSLAAMSHPITALYGGTFLLVIGAFGWAATGDKRRVLTLMSLSGTACLLIMSPWLYVAGRFAPELRLSRTFAALAPLESDALRYRLLPFPLDPRSVRNGVKEVSTPYLNTQINSPLLGLGLVFVAAQVRWKWAGRTRMRSAEETATCNRGRDRLGLALCASGVGIAAIALSVSSSQPLAAHVPPLFKSAQFAYRLVTYVNLGLLTCTFGLLLVTRPTRLRSPFVRHACAALIAVAALAVVQQQIYAIAISRPWELEQAVRHPLMLPRFYPAGEYSVLTTLEEFRPPPPVRVGFTVYSGRKLGDVPPVAVRLDQPATVLTNVMAFPWNQLTLDGQPIGTEALGYSDHWLVVDLPAGAHTLGYRFEPDRAWRALRVLSWATFGLLAVFIGTFARW